MIRALFDLVRALFIRPDQLSVPMTERRPTRPPICPATCTCPCHRTRSSR